MSYQSVTLAQLRVMLQQKYESSPFWTDEEARKGLNETLLWWNLFTGQWKRTVSIPTVANQSWYSLPSTLVFAATVQFESCPLSPTSLEDLDNGRSNWEGETSTRPLVWAPAGLKLIAIWPADSVGGLPLVVDGVRATPVLVNETDYVDIGQEELAAILVETLHRFMFKEGGKRLSSTASWHKDFIAAAGKKNSRLTASAFFRRYLGADLRENLLEAPRPAPARGA